MFISLLILYISNNFRFCLSQLNIQPSFCCYFSTITKFVVLYLFLSKNFSADEFDLFISTTLFVLHYNTFLFLGIFSRTKFICPKISNFLMLSSYSTNYLILYYIFLIFVYLLKQSFILFNLQIFPT